MSDSMVRKGTKVRNSDSFSEDKPSSDIDLDFLTNHFAGLNVNQTKSQNSKKTIGKTTRIASSKPHEVSKDASSVNQDRGLKLSTLTTGDEKLKLYASHVVKEQEQLTSNSNNKKKNDDQSRKNDSRLLKSEDVSVQRLLEYNENEKKKEDAVQAALEALKKFSISATTSSGQPTEDKQSDTKLVPPLRPYQSRLVEDVLSTFKQGSPSILLYLPTGGGKTAVAASIAKKQKGKVAVFVHRDELALQMKRSFVEWGFDETNIGFLKGASKPSGSCSIIIASIQAFARRYMSRTDQSPPEFSLIIIDEAHHAMANEYLGLLQLYPSTSILGLTATPFRLQKGELLGDIFFARVNGPSVAELIEDKWLVPPVFVQSSVSKGTVGRRGAKLDETVQRIVTRWKKHFSHTKTLAFCMDIEHAKKLKSCFEKESVRVKIVTGKSSPEERNAIFAESREKEIDVICSVDVVSEGVDTVWIDCLILLRPTESKSLFIQQVGRGLRPFKDKEYCLVLDEVGNVYRHGFIDDVVESDSPSAEESGKRLSQKRTKAFNCTKQNCMSLVKTRNSRCLLCIARKALAAVSPAETENDT